MSYPRVQRLLEGYFTGGTCDRKRAVSAMLSKLLIISLSIHMTVCGFISTEDELKQYEPNIMDYAEDELKQYEPNVMDYELANPLVINDDEMRALRFYESLKRNDMIQDPQGMEDTRESQCVRRASFNTLNACRYYLMSYEEVVLSLPFFMLTIIRPACGKHSLCYACGQKQGWTQKDCDDKLLEDLNLSCDCKFNSYFRLLICKNYARIVQAATIISSKKYSKKSSQFCSKSCVEKGIPRLNVFF